MGQRLRGRTNRRAGEVAPIDCGNGAAAGLWFVGVNVVRDLLALTKTEISSWDSWRQLDPARGALDAATLTLTDDLPGCPSRPGDQTNRHCCLTHLSPSLCRPGSLAAMTAKRVIPGSGTIDFFAAGHIMPTEVA